METHEEILRESYEYFGHIELACGGASGQQQEAYNEQVNTEKILSADFNKEFQGNQSILDGITQSLQQITTEGAGQFGFTPEEVAAKNTEAATSISAAGRQASGIAGEELAAQGGGNVNIPSGAKAAILGSEAEKQAQQLSNAQMGIQQQGYETGRQNYFQAQSELASAPGQLENPTTDMASRVTGSEELAGQTANEITQANNAWIAPVAGLVGGIAGKAIPTPKGP